MRSAAGVLPILSISPRDADHEALDGIFHGAAGWSLHRCSSPDAALPVILGHGIPVVLCASDPGSCTWQEVLENLQRLPDPPFFILTTPDADGGMWAEALNLGAYDVLVQPFDPREVIHRITAAWSRWSDQRAAPLTCKS